MSLGVVCSWGIGSVVLSFAGGVVGVMGGRGLWGHGWLIPFSGVALWLREGIVVEGVLFVWCTILCM